MESEHQIAIISGVKEFKGWGTGKRNRRALVSRYDFYLTNKRIIAVSKGFSFSFWSKKKTDEQVNLDLLLEKNGGFEYSYENIEKLNFYTSDSTYTSQYNLDICLKNRTVIVWLKKEQSDQMINALSSISALNGKIQKN
jgi:hypothetical protein